VLTDSGNRVVALSGPSKDGWREITVFYRRFDSGPWEQTHVRLSPEELKEVASHV
jgi:hypothetical protein